MTKEEIQAKLAELDPNNRDNLNEIAQLKTKIVELEKEEQQQQRVTAQVEKVESISLPYDFNEVFGDPRANEIILELIQDMQLQGYADHNAEVETLIAEHKAEVAEEKEKRVEIYTQLGNTSRMFNELETAHKSTLDELQQAKLERDDAINKRDAAVRQADGLEQLLAEKQEHIDKLRDEIAIGAKAAINVTNISPSDKLAQLVQESKNAKVKSALDIALENSAPFRGKVIKDGEVVAGLYPPEVTPFPTFDNASDSGYQLVTGPTGEVLAEDTLTPSEEEVQVRDTVDLRPSSENGQTLEEAFRRIEALEAKLGV